MQPKLKYNFVCRSCDAKLLVIRVPSPFHRGERATCPNCMGVLPPRDAADLLQYHLVQCPAPPAEFRPKGTWYPSRPTPNGT